MRKEPRSVAIRPRVERTERLEGSRFVAWQLYGLLAGGSRERLEVWQFYGSVIRPTEQTRWAKHCVGSFPGAACY